MAENNLLDAGYMIGEIKERRKKSSDTDTQEFLSQCEVAVSSNASTDKFQTREKAREGGEATISIV